MKSLKPIPTEYEEQCALVQWLEMKKLKFTAIPNSTYTKSWNQKARNTRSGLRPGLPDMLIVLPKKGLLFVEMKRTKNSKTYDWQTEWVRVLNTIPNVEAVICKGFEEARKAVESHLTKSK